MEAAEAPHCLQRPICDANSELSLKYGVVGRVVGSLLSNVVSKAFSWNDNKRFHLALEAASAGRNTHECATKFPRCSPLHKYTQDANEVTRDNDTNSHMADTEDIDPA